MRVRVNSIYEYQPNGWDRFHPTSNSTLQPGQLVRVINLPSAPPANTMGQCYVADPTTGKFLSMVSTGSLQPKPRNIHAHLATRETKVFSTDTVEGLKVAEAYKRKLENRYDKVTVTPEGLNRVRIAGAKA